MAARHPRQALRACNVPPAPSSPSLLAPPACSGEQGTSLPSPFSAKHSIARSQSAELAPKSRSPRKLRTTVVRDQVRVGIRVISVRSAIGLAIVRSPAAGFGARPRAKGHGKQRGASRARASARPRGTRCAGGGAQQGNGAGRLGLSAPPTRPTPPWCSTAAGSSAWRRSSGRKCARRGRCQSP